MGGRTSKWWTVLPRILSQAWIFSVMRPLRGEAALAALNEQAAKKKPCRACGKRWDEHFGKPPCAWWQG